MGSGNALPYKSGQGKPQASDLTTEGTRDPLLRSWLSFLGDPKEGDTRSQPALIGRGTCC